MPHIGHHKLNETCPQQPFDVPLAQVSYPVASHPPLLTPHFLHREARHNTEVRHIDPSVVRGIMGIAPNVPAVVEVAEALADAGNIPPVTPRQATAKLASA